MRFSVQMASRARGAKILSEFLHLTGRLLPSSCKHPAAVLRALLCYLPISQVSMPAEAQPLAMHCLYTTASDPRRDFNEASGENVRTIALPRAEIFRRSI
mmetsp:Transcript_36797/g.78256  ORF Transcript_36797/g.78256 Transcript_36797/m.78256 type:complete len:100 (+) Transcript_36797:1577-1876(+)